MNRFPKNPGPAPLGPRSFNPPWRILPLLLLAVFCVRLEAGELSPPVRLALWPGIAPSGEGKPVGGNAFVTVHRPAHPNGASVVICPGGGYGGLVTDQEGAGIARWLNQHGITGIVLEYRLPAGNRFVPLLDAQRAIRWVRSQAREWKCDPSRVGIMGFSAGGHLASTAATHFDAGKPGAADPVERMGSRPDFAILVYPVITMGELTHGGSKQNLLGPNPSPEVVIQYSSEKQVTPNTPPCFLAHARDDRAVTVENSRLFHQAMRRHHVESRLLELPSGDHGLNGYRGPMWDAWQSGSIEWLAGLKLIPAATGAGPSGAGTGGAAR